MRRRDLVALLGGSICGWPLRAASQQPERLRRIGLLSGGNRATNADRVDVLKGRLDELGWRDGSTVRFDERYADGDAALIPGLAAALAVARPDVLITTGINETRSLKAATRDIPIVFLQVGDPVAAGLVDSIARPGGNVTGLSQGPQLLDGRRLGLLVDLLGRPGRVGFIANPGNAGSESKWAEAIAAARNLGVGLERIDVSRSEDIDRAFASLAGADGAIVTFDFLLYSRRSDIAAAAARHRLPTIYEIRNHVIDGGLISYGPDLRDNYRRGADYVDRILRGAKAAELPVDQNAKFELVINLMTAKALGLTVPLSILVRADEVIE
ncbi:MAG: ABC transporter substrate-binding protein [Proteobacteria bacterium]|nr:ABC transporter substrate-binding protein [Pseudomonadota bacterium]